MLIIQLVLLVILCSLAARAGWAGSSRPENMIWISRIRGFAAQTPVPPLQHTDTPVPPLQHTDTPEPPQCHADITSTTAPNRHQYYHYCTTQSGQIAPTYCSTALPYFDLHCIARSQQLHHNAQDCDVECRAARHGAGGQQYLQYLLHILGICCKY